MSCNNVSQALNFPRVRLGDYIRRSTINNHDLKYGADLIEGVTNEGVFSSPKGDPIDIDLKPYKIVNNGAFVYNPSRLDLGSIAYRTSGLCIVSHLYIGTTIEEVRDYHRDSLIKCVSEANRRESQEIEQEKKSRMAQEQKTREHIQAVHSIAEEIILVIINNCCFS